MTGLEKILKQIHDEAQQKADEVIAQAKTEAAQIVENAKAEAKIQCGYIDEQSETAVQNYIASTKSAADLARRRAILTAKQEIIGAAIADAQQSIYSLPDADYFALILKMAGKFALAQDGEILFSPRDLARLPAGFAESLGKVISGEKLTISKETRDIDGGFVLVYGGIEENCSIEALFYAAREDLQDKVQELLFA
ncbi:V-type ATP synthase subunit E [Anaerotruncus rubiinfantis]|uniref:V-type ATP synthase subunit E n=1 Tax=Anaerotruncus rubiinfantis TaxID=1720200 RepID=UPI00082A77C1|nr:V-type ATP synthase subunit E [Anaerotruncus rubiinfantis]